MKRIGLVLEKSPRFTISDRTTQPLMRAERPYESMSLNCLTVRRDDDRWRMWYGTYDLSYRDDNDSYLCYATSQDGLRWDRPSLGLVSYDGNSDNNILIDQRKAGGLHAPCVFRDEGAGAGEEYKMVFARGVSTPQGLQWQVYGGVSPDGMRWQLRSEPLLRSNCDTQNVCFRDGDRYRLYVRLWSLGGTREVGYCESPEFGRFRDPRHIVGTDAQDPPDMQFYNPPVAKLDHGLYVMFPSGFHTGDQTVRPHLAVSRDGTTFTRVREVELPLGDEGRFDSKSIYVAPGAIPGERPHTFWFYYLGLDLGHDGKAEQAGGYGRFLLTVEP